MSKVAQRQGWRIATLSDSQWAPFPCDGQSYQQPICKKANKQSQTSREIPEILANISVCA